MAVKFPLLQLSPAILLPRCHRDGIKVDFFIYLFSNKVAVSPQTLLSHAAERFVFLKTPEQKPIYKTQAPLDRWQTPSNQLVRKSREVGSALVTRLPPEPIAEVADSPSGAMS